MLLHLLLKCPYEVHLAHYDHGWRSTSAAEAEQLSHLAKSLHLPFFSERAETSQHSELEAREQRWAFFKRLYIQGNYQVLLLAHHRDDQAETILKRLFEGAHLFNLRGIKPESLHEGMRVLRPLLEVSKAELQACGCKGIQDKTNHDPRYLRARMRMELFPALNNLFGKGIQNSLIRLGRYAEELEEILEKGSYSMLRGPFGLLVENFPSEKANIRYILHKIFKEEGRSLSEPLMNQMIDKILKKSANCRLHPQIYLDRGKLFLLNRALPQCTEWKVDWNQGSEGAGGWREMWKGRVLIGLPPASSYQLISPLPRPAAIDKLWTAKSVPAFLRDCLPLVTDGQQVIGEFLAGHKPKNECKICISLYIVSE